MNSYGAGWDANQMGCFALKSFLWSYTHLSKLRVYHHTPELYIVGRDFGGYQE